MFENVYTFKILLTQDLTNRCVLQYNKLDSYNFQRLQMTGDETQNKAGFIKKGLALREKKKKTKIAVRFG